jgi:hypothetical protein
MNTDNYQGNTWDPETLYRMIMLITPAQAKKKIPDLDPRLHGILKRTHDARKVIKAIKGHAHSVPQVSANSSGAENTDQFQAKRGCPECVELDDDERCVRTIMVTRKSNLKELEGSVLTFAKASDRIKPQVCFYIIPFENTCLITSLVTRRRRGRRQHTSIFRHLTPS